MDGFTQVHAAGLGMVIAGNSITDAFEVALLVSGSAATVGAGIAGSMAFGFADEIAFVAAPAGAGSASEFAAAFAGNAAGSLGLGALSAHDTSTPMNKVATNLLHTIES